MFKRLLASLCLLGTVATPISTLAQVPPIAVVSTLFSLPAIGVTPWVPLSGQSSCSINFASVGVGASITVEGASDAPFLGTQTPHAVTGIGTNGVITSPGIGSQFGGSITPQALTFLRLNLTGLVSGPVTGSLSCSIAPTVLTSTTATIVGPLGQTTMAGSVPVAIASNQSSIPVTVPVGQQASAASTPVVIASDQSRVPVSLPTAASTAAQVTVCDKTTTAQCSAVSANGDQAVNLTTVAGSAVTLGSKTSTASIPVVIASDQAVVAIKPPVTGANGTGTAAAANQTVVAGCNFTTAPATISTGNVAPIQCDNAGNVQVNVKAGSLSTTFPLTGAQSAGTAGAAGQAAVAACNFTTAPTAVTTGNVVPLACDSSNNLLVNVKTGTLTASPPITGANGTGTAGAAGQTTVAGCNFTTAPATLSTGNVGPVNCDNKGNLQTNTNLTQVGSSALSTSFGLPSTPMWKANAAGGGCDGVNTLTGTAIAKKTVTLASPVLGTSTSLGIGGTASTFVHICSVVISAYNQTASNINTPSNLSSTSAGCPGTVIANFGLFAGAGNVTIQLPPPISAGDGSHGIYDSALSGDTICYSFPSFSGASLTVTYAVY